MRPLLIILLFTLFFSCSKTENLVVVDPYFSEIYDIEENSTDFDLFTFDFESEVNMSLNSYKKVIISPLIYTYYEDMFIGIDLYVLNDGVESEYVKYLKIDYLNAYKNLINEIGEEYSAISVIRDSRNDDDIIIKYLEDSFIDIDIYLINDESSKRSISDFIENNKNRLWIIDSKRYAYYIYNKVSDENVVLVDSKKMSLINNNINYSFELDMNDAIYKIVRENDNNIEYILKKY